MTLLWMPATAAAQPAPTRRMDVAASIGWLHLDTRVGRAGDQARWDSAFVGGVSAGWYWTDHLKTEIDAGGATEAQGFGNEIVVRDGRILNRFRQTRTQRTMLAVSQQYQFGRNAWFHPHVAAGVAVAFDRRTDYYDPIFDFFDPNRSRNEPLEPARTEGPSTVTTFRPFFGVGAKAYIASHAFVRSDLRVGGTTGRGIDEVIARIGVGFDF